MGTIIRLPFFLVGLLVWSLVGGAISLVNFITAPIFCLARVILPSIFSTPCRDNFTFAILRNGYKKLLYFLKYGG